MEWFTNISLVNGGFTWTVWIALAVVVIWIVVRWPKAATTTVWSVVRRIVSLVAVAVLSVLAVVAPLNAQYEWYPTIGDLLPATVTSAEQATGGSPRSAVEAHTAPNPLITGHRMRKPVSPQLRPTPSGAGAGLQDFTVTGPRSRVTSQVEVWFPKEYFREPNATFPVLFVLDGYAPSPGIYFKSYKIDQAIENLVAQGKMKPTIVVAPVWAVGRVDTECVDSNAGGNVETWLTHDVPAWVYDTFRVSPGRASFATFGMSAGGWCANMMAMLHPDTFAGAVTYGAYWQPDFDPSFVPFTQGSAEWRRYDLLALAKDRPPPIALWTLTGKNDQFAIPQLGRLERDVRAPTSLTVTVLSTGGHTIGVWQPYVQGSLEWLARASPAFGP